MNFTGLIIAVTTFLVIGLFHPIVIKSEYKKVVEQALTLKTISSKV